VSADANSSGQSSTSAMAESTEGAQFLGRSCDPEGKA
jgi:hypothetical protein